MCRLQCAVCGSVSNSTTVSISMSMCYSQPPPPHPHKHTEIFLREQFFNILPNSVNSQCVQTTAAATPSYAKKGISMYSA
jgi:hypothetical protein